MNISKNSTFSIDYIPKRIISLVPSQTELLYDLGLENSIVGLTKFCVHPDHARKTKTIVGGTKTIHLEKIKALSPDIILCNKEENTREIVEMCTKIAPTHVSDIFDLNDSKNLITAYGNLFSKKIEASYIIQKIDSQQKEFEKFIEKKDLLKVAYFIWRNPWMVAANSTFINYLLTINKFENIYGDLERYPEIDITNLGKKSDLEFILLSSEPYPFKEEHAIELSSYTEVKTIFVDGEFFSWYGSRLIKAFEYFKKLRTSIDNFQLDK